MKRLLFILLLLLPWVTTAQETCPPQPLPFFDDFNNVNVENHVLMEADDSLVVSRCWTYFQPGHCSSHDVWYLLGGGADGGFLDITCGTMWCGSLTESTVITDFPPRRHNQYIVSPPLQEQPCILTFRRMCHSYGLNDSLEAHLVVGFVDDIEHIRESFVPIDTFHYHYLNFSGFMPWFDDTLLIPWTGRGECRIAFLMDTMLHDFYYDTIFRRDSAIYPIYCEIYLDNILLQPYLRDTTVYYDTVCEGYAYEGYGFDLPPQQASLVHERDSSTQTENHHFMLHLTVRPNYDSVRWDSLYVGDTLWVADTALSDEGAYTFHLTGQDGACDTVLTVHFTLLHCVELSFVTNRDFIDFDYPVLTLEDRSSYSARSLWEFSDGFTIRYPRARRQFHHPLPDSIGVRLTSCNAQDCCADTAFTVYLKVRSVWFPNMITRGEEFGMVTSCEVKDYDLTVFNRRGQTVFHTTDPTAKWDTAQMPQGAYVYQYFLRDTAGDIYHGMGTVTVLR